MGRGTRPRLSPWLPPEEAVRLGTPAAHVDAKTSPLWGSFRRTRRGPSLYLSREAAAHRAHHLGARNQGKEPTIHAPSMDVGLRQSGVSRSPPRIEAPGPAFSPACRGRFTFRSIEFSQKQSPPLSTATPLRVVVSLCEEGTGPLTGARRMPERGINVCIL